MREASARNKDLQQEIKQIEADILASFELENTPSSESQEAPPHTRHYKTEASDVSGLSITLSDDIATRWNDYVASNPAATIHHRYEWKRLFEDSYGHNCYYFCACDRHDVVVGILPLIHMQSRLFGNFLVSMPFFQSGGAVADSPEIEQALMAEAIRYATDRGVEHIEFRDDISRSELPAQSHKVNMVLALPEDEKALWNSFTPKLRAQIKKPQREETELRFAGIELLDDFYQVYSRNMRDLGSPAHSKQFIAHILRHFPDNSWLVVIRHHGKAVSAGLLLGHADMLEIPLASTVRSANRYSMNMLLYWEILKFAVEHGYRQFNFGRSSKGAGTYRFKQQWGARPQTLHWHYWLRDEARGMPSLNTSNPRYALVINIWKRLPLWITRIIGPAIVRYLP